MSRIELRWRRMRIRARQRFATSQGAVDDKETILVELACQGVVGRGEATPTSLYGQSLESTEQALAAAATLIGTDPFAIGPIMTRLTGQFDGQRAALAAIDGALHDWVGRRQNMPAWKLLGLSRPSVDTTYTIGVADPAEIAGKVDEALEEGFRALKVKVGVAHDEQTLTIIRERFAGPLFLDANCAWSPGEASRRIEALARFRPVMVEQPLRPEDWRHFGALRKMEVAPIFADESCERPADILRLNGLVDGVNIKFTKCGGIREALQMITLARALGMKIMLGCFLCTSLAIAPALTIATLVDYADLDGALLIADDPFTGIQRTGGRIELGEAPGMGLDGPTRALATARPASVPPPAPTY